MDMRYSLTGELLSLAPTLLLTSVTGNCRHTPTGYGADPVSQHSCKATALTPQIVYAVRGITLKREFGGFSTWV